MSSVSLFLEARDYCCDHIENWVVLAVTVSINRYTQYMQFHIIVYSRQIEIVEKSGGSGQTNTLNIPV